MAYKFGICLLLASLSLAKIIEEDDVWVLNESNFQEALEIQPDLLVEFYAPWCGNCKKFAPEYARAAKALIAKDPSVRIAKVDATRNSNLASEHGVDGYPTLKYFVNKKATAYSGNRTEDGIVSWVWKKAGPATIIVDNLSDLKKQVDSIKVAIVLFSQKDSADAKIFEKVAKSFEELAFFLSTDPKSLKEYDASEPTVVLFKRFDDEEDRMEGKFTQAKLKKFVDENKNPLLMKFDDAAIEYIFNKQHPAVLLFRFENETSTYDKMVSKVGKEFKADIAFSYADLSLSENKRLGEYLGFDIKDMPTVAIVDHKDGLNKYRLCEPLSELSVKTFIQDWKDEKLTPYIKSAPIPEDDFDGSVRVLVGKNFESVVYDPTKDVLVEFYAPWCGHCQALAPDYEKLAAEVKDNPNIIIAKVDGTVNEIKGINISSFPTLKWFPSNDKKGTDYDGERNYEELLKFVTEKSTTKTVEKTDL